MEPNRIGLFDLAERRLAWADQRQGVLAQNIANANTPRITSRMISSRSPRPLAAPARWPRPARTPTIWGTAGGTAPNEVVDRTHTQSPDGNAVALDEQLMKVADTDTTHALVTTIYKKYLGMFSMALGRNSSG